MKDLEDYLKANPELLRRYGIAQFLGSRQLTRLAIKKMLRSHRAYLSQNKVFDDRMPPSYTRGDIVVGQYAYDSKVPIKMQLEKQSGHCIFPGATGAGKTVMTLNILQQIQALYPDTSLRYLVFASKPMCEQRSLIINGLPGTAYFLDKRTLRINPFVSLPRIDLRITLADFARVISTELVDSYASGQLFTQKTLFEFQRTHPDGNLISYVDWLLKRKDIPSNVRQFRDRLVVKLQSMLFEIGDIFDCSVGLDRAFAEENIVVELPCSSSFILTFVAGIILARLFRMKGKDHSLRRYKNVIVLEDIQGGLRKG